MKVIFKREGGGKIFESSNENIKRSISCIKGNKRDKDWDG